MPDLKKIVEKEAAKEIELLAAMEEKLGKQAVELQQQLYRLLVDKYLDALQIDQNGNVLYNSKNLGYVNDLNKTWQTFQEKHYLPVINDFAKDLLSIVDIEGAYFTAIGKQFDMTLSMGNTLSLLQQQLGINIKTGELIEGSYLSRLFQGAEVRAKVADYVMANISVKTGFQDLKKGLEELVKGSDEVDGAMTRYLGTYAYDTFSQVQGAIDNKIAETYGFNWFIYQGDIISTSREFCIERVGNVYNRDDIADWETMDWAGKDWTKPFEEAKGGHRCRHTLMWIPDEAVEYFAENKDEIIWEIKEGDDKNEIGFNNATDTIEDFRKKINTLLREKDVYNNGVRAYMYNSESFTGWSNYLNTKEGKIRISDHGRPSKAYIYSDLHKSVVITDYTIVKDAKDKMNDLYNYIKNNLDTLFDGVKN